MLGLSVAKAVSEEAQASADEAAMRRQLGLALIVVVPVVCLLLSMQARMVLATDWTAAVRAELGEATARLEIASLTSVCAGDPRPEELCGVYDAAGIAQIAAWLGIVIGVALVVSIWVGGEWTRSDRRRLLLWFRPALYATLFGAMALALVDGVAVVGSVYAAMAALLDFIWPGIVGILAVTALVVAVAMAQAARDATRSTPPLVLGTEVSADDAPELWATVHDLAAAIDAQAPEHVVLGLDPTFYVTEGGMRLPSAEVTGRAMFLSLPLCQALSTDELRAVMAHELAHFRGDDTAWSLRFYPIYRGASRSLRATHGVGGWNSIPALPARSVLSYFLERFAENERAISRDRELVADASAAEVVGQRPLGAALAKLTALDAAWSGTISAAVGMERDGIEVPDIVALYAGRLRASGPFDRIDLDADAQRRHPIDTHPPVRDRLVALGLGSDRRLTDELVMPDEAAVRLIDHATQIAERLTEELLGGVRSEATRIAAEHERRASLESFMAGFEERFDESKYRKGKLQD
jgi:Zn-dependent protease with chaperone function